MFMLLVLYQDVYFSTLSFISIIGVGCHFLILSYYKILYQVEQNCAEAVSDDDMHLRMIHVHGVPFVTL